MPVHPEELTLVGNLPDQAVLSKAQTCALTGLSEDTLNRLHHRGEGPVRVQLSPRRVGYTVGSLKAWLKEQSVAA
jgi:predicted DNA-binding transcriptional regulator AlpA